MALSDEVFWSGAYLRPIVGTETAQPIPGKYSISNRVVGSQKRKTEIIRIVVADSGDLAYEYSKENLQFDVKAAEHVTLDTGILRVWQKDGGEWKIAARFSFPYDHVGIPVKDVK
jgi:hypothetical protein